MRHAAGLPRLQASHRHSWTGACPERGVSAAGLAAGEFEAIHQAPPKKATDYPSNHFFFHRMLRMKNVFRHIATRP